MFSDSGPMALGDCSINARAVLDTNHSYISDVFRRWRHIDCLRKQWQQTTYPGRSLLSTITLFAGA